MPTWQVGGQTVPTDGARAELICATAVDVAGHDGNLEEAIRRLLPLAMGRLDLVELALHSCRNHLARHPADVVWQRAGHLLERAAETRVFD